MRPLHGKKVLIFVGDDYEELELWYPALRLHEAGAAVTVAGQDGRHMYHGKHGYPCQSNVSVTEVASADFDAVVIPGGWMPDKLRRDPTVLKLVREFSAAGKVVASICHGGWICISADIVRGVKMTSTPGIRDDLINAGAEWIDAAVVVDRHHISSRRPADLPDFCEKIILALHEHKP